MHRESPRLNGRRVGLFLLPTFTLSWGFEPLIGTLIGPRASIDLGIAPWSMLVPASVALSLQMFIFRDSPIHIRRCRERPLLIPISYLGLTVLYAAVTTLALAIPEQARVFSGLGNSVYAFTLTYLVRPADKVLSFGLGVYGLLCLVLIVLFVLRDPVWRDQDELQRSAAKAMGESRNARPLK